MSAIFVFFVVTYRLTSAIDGAGFLLFVTIFWLGCLAIAFSFYSTYACLIAEDVETENYERMNKLYLNGHPAWDYLELNVFKRLSLYIGHGLCYEAAALEMLAWKNYEDVVYVFADVWNPFKRCRCEHSWIEVKYLGIWWVIDPTWGQTTKVRLRWMHNLVRMTRYVRTFNSCSFWCSSLMYTFYKRLKRPSTSYLFGELGLFRRDPKKNSMYVDTLCVNRLGESGLSNFEVNPYILGSKKPVSQEILTQLLVRPRRMMPKMRAQRRARALAKKFQTARQAS